MEKILLFHNNYASDNRIPFTPFVLGRSAAWSEEYYIEFYIAPLRQGQLECFSFLTKLL